VSEADILLGHLQLTRRRFLAHDNPVLILHDTSQWPYCLRSTPASGHARRIAAGTGGLQVLDAARPRALHSDSAIEEQHWSFTGAL